VEAEPEKTERRGVNRGYEGNQGKSGIKKTWAGKAGEAS